MENFESNGKKIETQSLLEGWGKDEPSPAAGSKCPTVVAFYLPQFYQTEYNNSWWGKGFTEWTNVSKAKPAFQAHYQPHLPADLGFYDLTAPGSIGRQVDLAKTYGIDAFCFYHYWFDGKRLLDKPLDLFIKEKLDFPFMICWANENWTANWDGGKEQILVEQTYSEGFEERFIEDSARYLAHPNYIKDNGKPTLLIYRPEDMRSPKISIDRMRKVAKKIGLGDLNVLAVASFGTKKPADVGCDGLVEFPPLNFKAAHSSERLTPIRDWSGTVYDTRKAALISTSRPSPTHRFYRGAMPSWDNTPRRADDSTVFINSSPELFKLWLTHHLISEAEEAKRRNQLGLVFVNAWNEWAEGAHLEPDRQNGTQWLEAVHEARLLFSESKITKVGIRKSIGDQLVDFSPSPAKEISILSPLKADYLREAFKLIRRDPSGKELWLASQRFFESLSRSKEALEWQPASASLPEAVTTPPDWTKLTCHVHAFHADFLARITQAIDEFPKEVSWIITVPKGTRERTEQKVGKFENCRVLEVENAGRNFGALFAILNDVRDGNFLLHVHSKKSKHMPKFRSEKWSTALFEGLLNRERIDAALRIMQENEDVPLYYPTAEKVLSRTSYNWSNNANFAKSLIMKLGYSFVDARFPYPAGGMFMCSPWLLQQLRNLNLTLRDFPAEPIPVDGSIAHALERIVGYVPHYLGLKHLTLSMGGVMSFDTSYIDFDSGY